MSKILWGDINDYDQDAIQEIVNAVVSDGYLTGQVANLTYASEEEMVVLSETLDEVSVLDIDQLHQENIRDIVTAIANDDYLRAHLANCTYLNEGEIEELAETLKSVVIYEDERYE